MRSGDVIQSDLLFRIFRGSPFTNTHFCHGLLEVDVDATAGRYAVTGVVQMLLSTILKNSYDALPKTGRRKGDIHLRVRIANAGRMLEFICTDRGVGIDDSMKERLFRPFASTRGSGRGLGLYLTKRLIAELGGSLDLEYSSPAKGTQFRLSVPADRVR